jgi:hypothetical protein
MKKFLLLVMLAGTVQLVKAQDFKKVQTTVLLTKWDEAKTEIDRLMLDPKSGATAKAEGWYWKAKIYAALAKNPATLAKYPTATKEADEAFRKYAQLDPTLAMVKEKGAEGYFDMYSASYNNAIKVFNDKKWEEAAHLFESAIYYIDNVIKNKWTNANIAFDTTSLLYAGYSFQNASKLDDAAKYYSVLADAKVGGDVYKDIYKFLVTHYTATKNDASFKKYLAIGRELYPAEPWDEYEIDFMDKNNTLAQKTEIYDKEDAAGTLSEMKYLQFGDVFINAKNKSGGLDSAQQAKYALKAADAFKKAYAKNNQNAIAAFNVGVIYYNIYGDYDDIYAANIRTMQGLNADRPVEKDPKKKAAADAALKAKTDPLRAANAAIEKPMMENLDYSLEWLEKSYNVLKNKTTRNNTEKSVINKSVDFLANMYAYKRDRMRGKDSKAFDAFDAKFKEYDALHAKF